MLYNTYIRRQMLSRLTLAANHINQLSIVGFSAAQTVFPKRNMIKIQFLERNKILEGATRP